MQNRCIASLSIDTWDVDYVLLRGSEEVLPCYAYRDSRTEAVIPKVHELMPFSELYRRTGIQTTGNYPGRARTPEELMADIDKVLSLIPGTPKMNLHASYAIFEDGAWVDRDKLEPKHFKKWVDFCKARGLSCDFNPTFFSHPKCDPLTLSSPNEETRRFWIDHSRACIRISNYLAEELKTAPFGEVWDEYCRRCGKPVDGAWYHKIEDYEKKVLVNRV